MLFEENKLLKKKLEDIELRHLEEIEKLKQESESKLEKFKNVSEIEAKINELNNDLRLIFLRNLFVKDNFSDKIKDKEFSYTQYNKYT